MKNILISGGGGFLGKNLIKFLLTNQEINKIIVLDTFITSSEDSFENMFKDIYFDKIILYKYDICNVQYSINDFLKYRLVGLKIHEIYHFESLASPPFYKKYPLETLDVGYIGTKNMLELAREHNSKFLFASTSEVYGDALISPQDEEYYGNVNSFGERSCYDESKRVGEALCYTYLRKYLVDVKIARIFNSYGPHMLLDDGRIITECIRNLKNDSELTIYGDGEQTRSFCYTEDTISMLVKLMSTTYNYPVNIGNENEMTINECVTLINTIWNELLQNNDKIKVKYLPLTQNDPLQRRPNLVKNREILGETFYKSFENGITKTIKYFLENNNNISN